MKIEFNKIYKSEKELEFIKNSIEKNISYQKDIENFFSNKLKINNFFLTPSATTSIEAISIACNISKTDEIILPSYTLSSTANAFAMRGAKLIFADSNNKNPNISLSEIKKLTTNKTKLIIVVHYGGISCDIEEIADFCKKNNIILVEDSAQAFFSFYKDKALGTFGDFGVYSFHKTKNIVCGEGGALIINNKKYTEKIDSILNKGTNISDFRKNKVSKYEWTNIGLSGTMAEINKAYLFGQLTDIEKITKKRKKIWEQYQNGLLKLEQENKLFLPNYNNKINYHLFYIVCNSESERNKLKDFLNKKNIEALFHFNSLHKSKFFNKKYFGKELTNSEKYSKQLLRLPLHHYLSENDISTIIKAINDFYN